MWINRIEADRLRNLKAIALDLDAGLTVIAGRNGQGKSSFLESVYLLATGRSFKTRKLDDLVAWRGGPLRVAGEVTGRLGQDKLAVLMDAGQRRLLVNDGEKDLESYLGRLDIVDLTAERMNVLRGSPVERRRFLDRGVVGLRSGYLRALGEYRRVLAHRNALLRRGRQRSESQHSAELDVWDERLRVAAGPLHLERRKYAMNLATRLGEVERTLFPGGGQLRIRYQPSPAQAGELPPERFSEVFSESLADSRSRDLVIGHTCQGPHRDDLAIELADVDLRRFGSAGQVRAAMVALKVAKLCVLREERGEAPVFLMDDYDTDLDEYRASALAEFLKEGGFQALVATSKMTLLGQLGVEFTKLRMDDGVAKAA